MGYDPQRDNDEKDFDGFFKYGNITIGPRFQPGQAFLHFFVDGEEFLESPVIYSENERQSKSHQRRPNCCSKKKVKTFFIVENEEHKNDPAIGNSQECPVPKERTQ